MLTFEAHKGCENLEMKPFPRLILDFDGLCVCFSALNREFEQFDIPKMENNPLIIIHSRNKQLQQS